MLREGFYLDDLDSDGEDVPEVKLVTTLEAGAGVSIGLVTAGLKGSVTLDHQPRPQRPQRRRPAAQW